MMMMTDFMVHSVISVIMSFNAFLFLLSLLCFFTYDFIFYLCGEINIQIYSSLLLEMSPGIKSEMFDFSEIIFILL